MNLEPFKNFKTLLEYPLKIIRLKLFLKIITAE